MEMNKKDFLKKIDREIEYYYSHKADIYMMLLMLIFVISLIVLSIISFFFENTNNNNPVLLMILLMLGLFLSVMMSKSIFVNNKMNKKYGKNQEEKIKVLIHDTCSIEDMQEYYESASDTFKKYYLDVLFEKEIANSLGLEKDYDKAELLEKLKNINKLEIENT